MFLRPLYNPLPFYCPLSSLRSSVPLSPLCPLGPYVSSTALYPLWGALSPLRPSASYTALCTLCSLVLASNLCQLFSPLSPLLPYVPLYVPLFLYGALLPLRSSAPSTTLCPLYGPLFSLQSSVSSTVLGLLYRPLSPLHPSSPLRPSVLSTALCLLYSPLSPSVPTTAFCALYRPISSMDLCSLNSPLSPQWLSVPLRLYVLSTLSFPFTPTVSPFLCLPLLSLRRYVSTYMPCVSHIWFLSLYLFPFVSFPPFLLLSLPFVTPSVSPYASPLFLFSISPLCLSSCISSLLSPSLHLSSCTPYVYLIHNFRDNRF